jgi:hypothetical protein
VGGHGCYTVTEIAVSNNPRVHGESKYGVWNRLFKSFRDLLAIRWMKSRLVNYQVELKLDRGRDLAAAGSPKVEVMTNPAIVSGAGEVKTGAA